MFPFYFQLLAFCLLLPVVPMKLQEPRTTTLHILILLLLGVFWSSSWPASAALAGKRPNIIFILTDDQGYGDLSAHGNPILQTPHLDRLHHESVRFTDFHVSPTCSPTRSALLTGRHEFKNGVTHTILERERLTLRATTLAEVLQEAGYKTGIFGKWHLGDEPKYRPNRRGFDEMFIHGGGGIGQTYPGSCGDVPGNRYFDPMILHNGRMVRSKGYCTDVFFGQALRWMELIKGRQPFFAYIACNAPHVPLQVRPEDEARYSGRVTNQNAAKFLGMVANIDDNIGRLLEQLRVWNIERETLVIFMTDNGADGGSMVYNAGLRGKKGSAFLGGTKAVSFWRWPGVLVPADVSALTAHIDFFPTIAELTGARLTRPVQRQVEGRSLVPVLENPLAPWAERTLFTHFGRWPKGADPNSAKYKMCSVRVPRWHLVSADGATEPRWMLFDVETDYGEQHDIAVNHPAVVERLAAAYEHWWTSVQPMLVNEKVVGPKVNPFKALFWKQWGGGPSDEDLRLMNPASVP
jgi:arylsulfatase